jgi:hypothetical protein
VIVTIASAALTAATSLEAKFQWPQASTMARGVEASDRGRDAGAGRVRFDRGAAS